MNVTHTIYPVIRIKINTGQHVMEGIEKRSLIAYGQDIVYVYKECATLLLNRFYEMSYTHEFLQHTLRAHTIYIYRERNRERERDYRDT